jgi:hypothetical protein
MKKYPASRSWNYVECHSTSWLLDNQRTIKDIMFHYIARVAHYISKCVTCRKLRRANLTQKMSDLPEERLEPAAPFTYTGMEFGPWHIKDGQNSTTIVSTICQWTVRYERKLKLQVSPTFLCIISIRNRMASSEIWIKLVSFSKTSNSTRPSDSCYFDAL